jgi:hypothetical protein
MNRANNAGDCGRQVSELLDPRFHCRLRPAAAEFMAPMLATLTGTYFSDSGWLFERKLDGVRALVVRDESGARLYSRTHHAMSQTYPELVEALDTRVPVGCVVDGEIVAFDGEQTSFSRLQARIGLTTPAKIRQTGVEVFLYLFDVLVGSPGPGCDAPAVAGAQTPVGRDGRFHRPDTAERAPRHRRRDLSTGGLPAGLGGVDRETRRWRRDTASRSALSSLRPDLCAGLAVPGTMAR